MTKHDQETTTLLQTLQDPKTIRRQALRILDLARQDKLVYFSLVPEKMAETAAFVLEVIKTEYPDLAIPYHSRWRHFEVGGIDRIKALTPRLAPFSLEERGKILSELVIISVLLDAGAGTNWSYKEASSGQILSRSEGLAVASLELYLSGAFSIDPKQPLRADAQALVNFSEADLANAFQLSSTNPLAGVEGRIALINALGKRVGNQALYFGEEGRLGNFYTYLLSLSADNSLKASQVFKAVLSAFNEIWPQRLQFAGTSLGDVWIHKGLKTEALGSDYIPFHKLSQWLSYSLLEPLELAGIEVTDLDELTGLPEYRNGGLLLDSGLLEVKNEATLEQLHEPGSEVIVEWRALTVALLDELAATIRLQLQRNAKELPLAKILQGGTWEAGRRLAKQKRKNGAPPLQIISDGTVF